MKLKGCECGGTPELVHDLENNLYSVECPQCNSTTPQYSYIDDSQQMWNTWCFKAGYCTPEHDTA